MRLEAGVVRLALRLLRVLGPVGASNLCGAVARAVGPLLPVSRVAHRNLAWAMPELERAARRRVVRGVWDNLGRTVGELPHVAGLREAARSGPGWVIEGGEVLRALAERGGPAILVSGHIGNWEMLPAACARYGVAFSSLYRAADNPLVDREIVRLRQNALAASDGGPGMPPGMPTVPMFAKGSKGARQALAHLRRGGFLGMLVDQKMNDGIEARFFGRPAMTASALASLAVRTGCPVIPGYVERIGPARLRVIVEPPLTLAATGDAAADVLALTQAVNDRLEAWIRRRPETWLWLHRRWPKQVY